MNFKNFDGLGILSKLLVHEIDPSSGYSRRTIIIDDDSENLDIPMGILVYRDNDDSVLDITKEYTLFDVSNEYGDGDVGNPPVGPHGETSGVAGLTPDFNFAIVFGDEYSAKDSWVTNGEGDNKAVAIVRGEIQLKAETVWEANNIDDADDKKAVKALLARQGILLLESDEATVE